MAEGAKITPARAAAYAAFACAAAFVILLALTLNVWVVSVDGAASERRGAFAYFWGGWVLTLVPAPAILLLCLGMWPPPKARIAVFLTMVPSFVAAGCAVFYGHILADMGQQMLERLARGGPGDGAFAMGVAFMMFFIWLLLVGMALAALIACFGVARPLGPLPLLAALVAAGAGLGSFLAPILVLVSVAAMAAWWLAVGAGLWRLEKPAGASPPGQGAP